ncbi:hypothetical protein GCM10023238_24180 [Streptomyces heliomycini]
MERKRSDSAERRLAEGRVRAQENRRLERGLLPTRCWTAPRCGSPPATAPAAPAPCSAGTSTTSVRTPDGTVHAMIADVCGHGPRRGRPRGGAAHRLARADPRGAVRDRLLGTLQQVLEHERPDDEIFAT